LRAGRGATEFFGIYSRSPSPRRRAFGPDRQYEWGRRVFALYVSLKPSFAVSWHLLGPRPADSMFYIERWEP